MAKRKTFEEKKAEFIKTHLENDKWSYTQEWFDKLSDDDLKMLIETNLAGLKYNTKRVAKKYLSFREVKKEDVKKSGRKRGEIAYTDDQIKAINTILNSADPTKIKLKTKNGTFTVANKGISFTALDSEGNRVKVAGAKITGITGA
ncbi:hypothetical protein [Spirochaeta isovalerica]|uniref:Uncharacterized protein n=1 Tax=Spirochaeta isovalerica TaxID=150 RepID=A0A841R979_9SPIO|nr:hypothetical protein [Spirochaeta isovalerica]MBB6481874.1 hypothetical protein [Spirochaeta isovalerica]